MRPYHFEFVLGLLVQRLTVLSTNSVAPRLVGFPHSSSVHSHSVGLALL